MAWQSDLRPASWRGIPFFVEASQANSGRNTAVHVYPFREQKAVWVEDLGAAPLVIRITGFLIGDDARQQVLALFDAMQRPGQAELVHPVYGSRTGSIVGGCRYAHRKDRGRYAEIEFEFVANEADAPYPALRTDTRCQVTLLGARATLAAAQSFRATILGGIAAVRATIAGAVGFVQDTIGAGLAYVGSIFGAALGLVHDVTGLPGLLLGDALGFGGLALGLVSNASSALNAVYGLGGGDFGRYAALVVDPSLTSESAAVAAATTARAAVSVTIDAMITAINNGADVPPTVQAVLAAVAIALPNPADRISAFAALVGIGGPGPLGGVCRQLSLVALAVACSAYEPASYDDAHSLLGQITGACDVGITAAGDAGDDAVYNALIMLRVAVVADLTARGADLAPLKTVTFGESQPHLVVAAFLYNDARRADELVRRVGPVHPLFMPTTMQVLSR